MTKIITDRPGPSLSADLITLALNVYWEARNQSRVGQLAVALVTMNRVKDSRWPNTITGVVWQDTDPLNIGGEQFSWTSKYADRQDALNDVLDPEAFKEALSVALEVLSNHHLLGWDFTLGANLYHADYVQPYWRHHPRVYQTAKIGKHLFYEEVS